MCTHGIDVTVYTIQRMRGWCGQHVSVAARKSVRLMGGTPWEVGGGASEACEGKPGSGLSSIVRTRTRTRVRSVEGQR